MIRIVLKFLNVGVGALGLPDKDYTLVLKRHQGKASKNTNTAYSAYGCKLIGESSPSI
jgi:hypothetical protein